MKTSIKILATRTALFALTLAASATICSAQENSARPAHSITITAGQGGGYTFAPDTRPVESYALTGEPSSYRQTLQAWLAQAGPVLRNGNASIVIPPTR